MIAGNQENDNKNASCWRDDCVCMCWGGWWQGYVDTRDTRGTGDLAEKNKVFAKWSRCARLSGGNLLHAAAAPRLRVRPAQRLFPVCRLLNGNGKMTQTLRIFVYNSRADRADSWRRAAARV